MTVTHQKVDLRTRLKCWFRPVPAPQTLRDLLYSARVRDAREETDRAQRQFVQQVGAGAGEVLRAASVAWASAEAQLRRMCSREIPLCGRVRWPASCTSRL